MPTQRIITPFPIRAPYNPESLVNPESGVAQPRFDRYLRNLDDAIFAISGTGSVLLGKMSAANFNSTDDQPVLISLAAGVTKYIVRRITVAGASISLTTAVGGIYTDVAKGGSTVVGAAQSYAALTAPEKFLDLTLDTLPTTEWLQFSKLYFSLTTPQGAAATADVYFFGEVLS